MRLRTFPCSGLQMKWNMGKTSDDGSKVPSTGREHRNSGRRSGAVLRLAGLFLAVLLAAGVPAESAYAASFLAVMYETVVSSIRSSAKTQSAASAKSAASSAKSSADDSEASVDADGSETAAESQEAALSFYQKLACGEDVTILVIGDSIGAGAGASSTEAMWFNVMTDYLADTYYGDEDNSGGHILLTNVSMCGNDSYAGYVTAMAFDDGVDYDLVILCYGQNDSLNEFAEYYEAFIRAVKTRYPNASLLSVLESSQETYTEKILQTIELCSWYAIPMVDTIAAFAESGYDMSELTYDGVHPSDLGQRLYALYAELAIENNIALGTEIVPMPEPYGDRTDLYDEFQYYAAGDEDADSTVQFTRVSDTSYTLTVHAEGTFGIYYSYNSGDSVPDIYIDGVQVSKPIVLYDYDFPEGLIQVFGRSCMIQQEITLVFETKEQADGFLGLCVSW